MISKVGKDSFGTETFQNFKENGISTDYVGVSDKAASGIATIIVDSKGTKKKLSHRI
jgi:sugar/nucleoside kinase (ribokinase family)